jgi:galactokinase
VSGRAITEQLVAHGLERSDAESQATLFDQAQAALIEHTRRSPAWAWWIPGRIEVIGKHTDYAGGRSLVASVPRGFVAVATPRDDTRVVVLDARWRQRVDVDLAGQSRRAPGWGNYVSTVGHRLRRDFPGAPLGTTIAIASDLPRAAGLSSSSALVVAVALALIRRGAIDTSDEWKQEIRNPLDLAGYLGAIESGSGFGAWPGASGVGTHGGSEDHTAILNARAGHVSAFRYVPVQHLGDVSLPRAWRFIVMTSGIRADKAGTVRDQYNRAAIAAQAICSAYEAQTARRFASLAAILESSPDAGARLRQGLTAELMRRLDHFEAETQRVLDAVAAFDRGDEQAIGAIAAASQSDAARLLGNQVDETTRLAALARAAGAFAATSFGAGFGGSVWALAHENAAASIAAEWRRAYLLEFPSIRDVDWFITRPAPAALEVQL